MNAKTLRLISDTLNQLELTQDTRRVIEFMAEAVFQQGYMEHAEETGRALKVLEEKAVKIIKGE